MCGPLRCKRCSADRRLDLQVCITCIMQARLFSERVRCACFRLCARFSQVPGRLNLRHDLRAWSSLRLDPKLPRRAVPDGLAGEIDWLRVDPARDSLSSASSPSVPDPLSLHLSRLPPRVLNLLPTYHFHFTSLRPDISAVHKSLRQSLQAHFTSLHHHLRH